MGNKGRGNHNRCTVCGKLGGRDKRCKLHRPVESRLNPMRENWKEFGIGFKSHEEREEFGIIQDFGMNRRWA